MAEAKKSSGGYKAGIDFNLNPCAPVFLLLVVLPISVLSWLMLR